MLNFIIVETANTNVAFDRPRNALEQVKRKLRLSFPTQVAETITVDDKAKCIIAAVGSLNNRAAEQAFTSWYADVLRNGNADEVVSQLLQLGVAAVISTHGVAPDLASRVSGMFTTKLCTEVKSFDFNDVGFGDLFCLNAESVMGQMDVLAQATIEAVNKNQLTWLLPAFSETEEKEPVMTVKNEASSLRDLAKKIVSLAKDVAEELGTAPMAVDRHVSIIKIVRLAQRLNMLDDATAAAITEEAETIAMFAASLGNVEDAEVVEVATSAEDTAEDDIAEDDLVAEEPIPEADDGDDAVDLEDDLVDDTSILDESSLEEDLRSVGFSDDTIKQIFGISLYGCKVVLSAMLEQADDATAEVLAREYSQEDIAVIDNQDEAISLLTNAIFALEGAMSDDSDTDTGVVEFVSDIIAEVLDAEDAGEAKYTGEDSGDEDSDADEDGEEGEDDTVVVCSGEDVAEFVRAQIKAGRLTNYQDIQIDDDTDFVHSFIEELEAAADVSEPRDLSEILYEEADSEEAYEDDDSENDAGIVADEAEPVSLELVPLRIRPRMILNLSAVIDSEVFTKEMVQVLSDVPSVTGQESFNLAIMVNNAPKNNKANDARADGFLRTRLAGIARSLSALSSGPVLLPSDYIERTDDSHLFEAVTEGMGATVDSLLRNDPCGVARLDVDDEGMLHVGFEDEAVNVNINDLLRADISVSKSLDASGGNLLDVTAVISFCAGGLLFMREPARMITRLQELSGRLAERFGVEVIPAFTFDYKVSLFGSAATDELAKIVAAMQDNLYNSLADGNAIGVIPKAAFEDEDPSECGVILDHSVGYLPVDCGSDELTDVEADAMVGIVDLLASPALETLYALGGNTTMLLMTLPEDAEDATDADEE